MQADGVEIKKCLEDTFDIPFSVIKKFENREPVFIVSPINPGKELFDIRISIRNQVRLLMEFVPQRYSVNFIAGMGHQGVESRRIFSEYARLFKEKGSKSNIKVNGSELDTDNPTSWPESWRTFEARVTKMPVTAETPEESFELIKEWSSLMMGMILSLADVVPFDPDVSQEGYAEGTLNRVEVNRYERNPLNRKLCLAVKGYVCQICGMDFEKKYGEIGHNFIHVHHIVPVSQLGENYVIDPLTDLIPVCPNCHAMLHRTNPPLMPDELKARISKNVVYSSPVQSLSFVAEDHITYGLNDDDK